MISPFSLDILKKETIPSKHLGTKILELIVSLRAKNSQEELHTIYQKNLSLLKTSIKLPKETPSLEQINSYQVLIFGTRAIKRKQKDNMNFFKKNKIFFIWLVSVYELLSKKPLALFKKNDWEILSSYIPKTNPFILKYKLFSYMQTKRKDLFWTLNQDQLLKNLLRKSYPGLFDSAEQQRNIKIRWSQISFELSKFLPNIQSLKTYKQCKERWLSHLNPFLKNDEWTLEEDLCLLHETLKNSKRWSLVSINFPGRTQHQIKNRFILVISKELKYDRAKIRELIKKNTIYEIVSQTLRSLNQKKTKKSAEIMTQTETSPNNILLTSYKTNVCIEIENNQRNFSFHLDEDQNRANLNYSTSSEYIKIDQLNNIDQFINFEKNQSRIWN